MTRNLQGGIKDFACSACFAVPFSWGHRSGLTAVPGRSFPASWAMLKLHPPVFMEWKGSFWSKRKMEPQSTPNTQTGGCRDSTRGQVNDPEPPGRYQGLCVFGVLCGSIFLGPSIWADSRPRTLVPGVLGNVEAPSVGIYGMERLGLVEKENGTAKHAEHANRRLSGFDS